MDKTSLPTHADYPMLPAQAVNIKPDTGCSTCPLAQSVGHKSCSTFAMANTTEVTEDNRISLSDLRALQYWVHRRATDLLGPYQSNYNAKKQYNFRIDTYWKLVSVSGNEITLEPQDEDASAKLIIYSFWRERDPEFGMFWVNGFEAYTAVSPNDWVTFSNESIASAKINARVIKIESCTDSQITLILDKSVDVCEEVFPDITPEPDYIGVTISHYGKEEEQWTFIEEPHFFYGAKVTKLIELSDIPEDGIYTLETGVIAPPDSFDPLDPNFILEGFKESAWHAVTDLTRLNIKPDLSTYSFGEEQPEGSIQETPTVDLRDEYDRFRVTYYKQTDVSDSNCGIRGFDRCLHSATDFTNSGYEATGVTTADGKVRFCAERVYTTYTYIDDYNRFLNQPVPPASPDGIPDRVDCENHHPTGLSNYPEDAKCIQYGYCDKYVNPVTALGSKNAPFMLDHKASPYFKELWHASDFKSDQLAVGYLIFDIGRILHPSVASLVGRYGGSVSPGGIHPQTIIFDGGWSLAEPIELTDEDDNVTLHFPVGFESGCIIGDLTPDTDMLGTVPDNIEEFNSKRDILDADNNAYEDNLLTSIAGSAERDSGELKGYSVANSSFAIAPTDILIPDVDLTVTETQHNSNSDVTVDGDIVIQVHPLRQPAKSELSIGSRIIHSVSHVSGNRYEIEFANADKSWSQVNPGDPFVIGDSFDEVLTVQASAVYPIMGYEWQLMDSYYERNKYQGDRKQGAWRGDTVEIDGRRFVVVDVRPSDGSEASGWGNRVQGYDVDLVMAAVLLPNNSGGDPYQEHPVVIDEVKNSTTSAIFDVLTGDKPEDLESGQCWFDGFKGVYFSADDDGEAVEIKYTNIDEYQSTEYIIVNGYKSVTLDINYSDYSSATATAFINGDPVSIIASGNPTVGQVKITDNSGNVELTINISSAPGTFRLRLEFSDPAPTPEDHWCLGRNFTDWGKKRDVIEVLDDIEYFDNDNPVGLPAQFIKSATAFKAKSSYQLQYTEQGFDSWLDVPAEDYVVESAAGKIVISPAFVVGLNVNKKYCFKLKNVELFDHRGHVSGDLYNVTKKVINAIQWARIFFSGGVGGAWSWGRSDESTGFWAGTPEDPCSLSFYPPTSSPTPFSPSKNQFSYFVTGDDMFFTVGYDVAFTTGGNFGMPELLKNLPSGAEILEAKAEIVSSGVTRTLTTGQLALYDCIGGEVEPGWTDTETTLSPIDCYVVGFTTPDDYTIIGSIPGATPNKISVADVTDIIEVMFNSRNSTQYAYGFGMFAVPPGIEPEGSFASLITGAAPVISYVSYCPGSTCYVDGEDKKYPVYRDQYSILIEWGVLTMLNLYVKVKYPDETISDVKVGMQRRFPAMVDLDSE